MIQDIKVGLDELKKDELSARETDDLYFIFTAYQADKRFRTYLRAIFNIYAFAAVKGKSAELVELTRELVSKI